MAWYEKTQLGVKTDYIHAYDPGLLCPLERREGREALQLTDAPLPFHGVDIWHNYEVSWLDPHGKPQVAIARIIVPADSPCLIESKSMKLYFNSLNQHRFADRQAVIDCAAADLSHSAGAGVTVELLPVNRAYHLVTLEGTCLDDLPLEGCDFTPNPGHLKANSSECVEETLHSHLLRSNCPVTGQPDWGSVQIRYSGPKIDREGLLRYLISFREHNDFHEQCVERIYRDIQQRCAPAQLTVFACYTRRGGLDINPWRSNAKPLPDSLPRLSRQ
jgi:7-cyano-7-deazaguanine reductase